MSWDSALRLSLRRRVHSPLEGEARVSTIAGHGWLPVLAVQAGTGAVLGQPHCRVAAGTSACSCLVIGGALDGHSPVQLPLHPKPAPPGNVLAWLSVSSSPDPSLQVSHPRAFVAGPSLRLPFRLHPSSLGSRNPMAKRIEEGEPSPTAQAVLSGPTGPLLR